MADFFPQALSLMKFEIFPSPSCSSLISVNFDRLDGNFYPH